MDDIIWITLESVRWDHTSFSDHSRDTTPELRKISSEDRGQVFNSCFSHGIYTRSSTASILTGRPASNHGVGIYRQTLPTEVSTIAEQLQHQGYYTVCISPNGHVSSATGLDRGFDEFRFITSQTILNEVDTALLLRYLLKIRSHSAGLSRDTAKHCIAYIKLQLAKRYLNNISVNKPLFLYVFFGDTHHMYYPPVPFQTHFEHDLHGTIAEALSLSEEFSRDLITHIAEGCPFTSTELNDIKVMYDSTISYIDSIVGELYDEVRKTRRDAKIVITSDHGENLGDDDLLGHRMTINKPLAHVPLVLSGFDEVNKASDILIQQNDVWTMFAHDVNIRLETVGTTDPRTEPRDIAVTQLGYDRCQKNLEEIQRLNPDYDTSKHPASDFSVVWTEDVQYGHEHQTSTEWLKTHTGVLLHEEQLLKELSTEFADWYTKWGKPIEVNEVEKELDADIRDNLQAMGYLVE